MAQEGQYGNWWSAPQHPSTTTTLQQKGIYVFAEPTAPALPLQKNSSSCPNEDEDYDDGGYVTQAVEQREDTDKKNVFSTTESTLQRRLHVFILYVLVAICLAMWAGLLSLVLIKYSAMSDELQALNLNYSDMLMRVWQDLDNIQAAQKIMERTVSNNFSELQDITASICGGGKSLVSHSCPTKWEMQGRNCYYFSSERKNWTDALWHCINKKANLVSVWSDEEQEFLRDNLNSLTHWLGMTDIEREGKWRWKEGNLLVSTTFWDKGEPQMSHEKNCGIIQPDGTWASAMCSLRHHWICKKRLIC